MEINVRRTERGKSRSNHLHVLSYDAKMQTYNQAMKTAKAQYSEDKKAYDNRTPEQVDAANAAAAAAISV
jgi:hypothetical protein